jgi:hypothetical protein
VVAALVLHHQLLVGNLSNPNEQTMKKEVDDNPI